MDLVQPAVHLVPPASGRLNGKIGLHKKEASANNALFVPRYEDLIGMNWQQIEIHI